MTKPSIAFLGTGLMGLPMARNLLTAGFSLTAWNRTRAKAEGLAAHGARIAETPVEAVAHADHVVMMLENGGICAEVLFRSGMADALKKGAIVIDMSSIKPSEAIAHAKSLGERGVSSLDAPVSGGTVGAQAGTLAIMVGGDAAAFASAEQVMKPMGRPVHVGPSGSGQYAKLANQIIVAATIGAIAEAFMLAHKGGADLVKLRESLRGGFAESRILDLHGQRLIERDFATRGRSVTHLKDLDNALDAAERLGLSFTPYTQHTADLFRDLLRHEGDLDHSALLLPLERGNALPETTVGTLS